MQVPSWLLFILIALSLVCLIIFALMTLTLIKNRQRLEKVNPPAILYQSSMRQKDDADASDSTEYSFMPATFTTIVQPNVSSTSSPASSDIRSKYKPLSKEYVGNCSPSANFPGSLACDRYLEKKPVNYNNLVHSMSLDNRFQRRQFRSSDSPVYPQNSPNSSPGPISSGSSIGDIISDALQPAGTEFSDEEKDIYVHSSFLPCNQDELSDDAVISFNQEVFSVASPGALSFSLSYSEQTHTLKVTVKRAYDLPTLDTDSSDSVNCHINFCLVPEDFLWIRTSLIENSRFPVFNETFEIYDVLYHKLREYMLCFFLMDNHKVMGERIIGKVMYPLSDLRSGLEIDTCIQLTPSTS